MRFCGRDTGTLKNNPVDYILHTNLTDILNNIPLLNNNLENNPTDYTELNNGSAPD
jgi:hypothetical protein